MRYTLVDGQGNFGSIDGDPAGGHALHRVPDDAARVRAARRHRQGDRRLAAELRRQGARADGPAGARFRTSSSTAPPASPSAWRPTSRRTTSARSSTAPSRSIDEPGAHRRRADEDHPRPGLPDRRLHLRARRASARPTRPAAARSSCAASAEIEEHKKGRTVDHRHRDPVHGEQGALVEKVAELVRDKKLEGITDIRDESEPQRHAHRVRAASKDAVPRGRPQQPVQDDRAAVVVRRQHAGDRRRAAAAAVAQATRCSTSSSTAATWSRAARCSICARRARARRSSRARASPSTTSTASSRSSAPSKDTDEAKATPDGRAARRASRGSCERAGRPEDEIAKRTEKGDYTLTERQAQAILDMRLGSA